MSAEIEGLTKLLAKLDKLADMKGVDKAMEKACLIVERDAIKKAPKDTGALKRSIQSKVKGSGNTVEGEVFTPLEYGAFAEYGTGLFAENGGRTKVPWKYEDEKGGWHTTSGMHPQPFMRPALNENRERILREIKNGIRDSLK